MSRDVSVKRAGSILLRSLAQHAPRPDQATHKVHDARLCWLRRIVESAAFARVYEAFPAGERLASARALVRSLRIIRGMVKEHRAGRLQPSAYSHSDDHEGNLAELRELAQRFPGGPREWILETAERIERYLSNSMLLVQTARDEVAPRELIGTRGRAGDDAGAFRGWLVRAVAKNVPDGMAQRGATVAKLLRLCGLDVTPGYVNAVLREWSRKHP